jgi:uncharacterized repeat protein (TIGR04076 family)
MGATQEGDERRVSMAIQPKDVTSLVAEVTAVKGTCSAGHKVGDTFPIGCWDSGGLCGFFYHDIFPSLNVMQFGGKFPWGEADEMTLECPDRQNALTLRVRRV